MIEQDPLIEEYSHEKQRPRESEALVMLRKVASIVKPIMRQRDWKVGVLSEFYPEDRTLLGLNVNRGAKILLRLRHAGDQKQFLPLEQVVDTMLHELSHIVFGPHDEKFHKLWNQLRDEHEALVRKGYTGEGFLSTGQKLGGGRIPMHEARRLARVAAEKRRVQYANSGQRLGGFGPARGGDIRKTIADAAQRRIDISKGCANTEADEGWRIKVEEEANRNGFRTKAEEDDANARAIEQAFIEMIQEEEQEKYGKSYTPPRADNSVGRRDLDKSGSTSMAPPPPPASIRPKPGPATPIRSPPSPEMLQQAQRETNGTWSCQICTLNNPPEYLCCDACGVERPSRSAPIVSSARDPGRTQPRGGSSSKPSSRLTADPNLERKTSVTSLTKLADVANTKPLGWNCHMCNTFMEQKWWTCSNCGQMKLNS